MAVAIRPLIDRQQYLNVMEIRLNFLGALTRERQVVSISLAELEKRFIPGISRQDPKNRALLTEVQDTRYRLQLIDGEIGSVTSIVDREARARLNASDEPVVRQQLRQNGLDQLPIADAVLGALGRPLPPPAEIGKNDMGRPEPK